MSNRYRAPETIRRIRFSNIFSNCFSRNPYEEILMELCRVRVLPHRSLDDLLHNRYTRRNLLITYGLIPVMMFSLVRLALLALIPTTECYELLIGYFYGMANNRVMILSGATLSLAAFLLGRNHLSALMKLCSSNHENQTSALHTEFFLLRAAITNRPTYHGFQILDWLRSCQLPAFLPLKRLLGMVWSSSIISRTMTMPFLGWVMLFDVLTNFGGKMDRYFWVRFMVFFVFIALFAFYCFTLAFIWLAIVIAVSGYYWNRYRMLRQQLERNLLRGGRLG